MKKILLLCFLALSLLSVAQNVFQHGVASGDPTHQKVILWTRVTPNNPQINEVTVKYTVLDSYPTGNVVAQGTSSTNESKDFTIKIDVSGLKSFTTYYYYFEALGQKSITGRTKTMPRFDEDVKRIRIGVTSCSNYPEGFFNGYKALAEKDLDFVVHLGDYLYEYGGSTNPDDLEQAPPGEELGRAHEPRIEITRLEDYRIRHAQYKKDPDLMRLHQLFPFMTIWDDHESSNNTWFGGANNHSRDGSDPNEPEGGLPPIDEGNWFVRKSWAQQAYDEWMPIRLPQSNNPTKIYRRITLGKLAQFIMLDTRLEGRDLQAAALEGEAFSFEAEITDTTRRLISTEQRNWLFNYLKFGSTGWNIIGNQVLMSQLRATGLPNSITEPLLLPAAEGGFVSSSGAIVATDVWDGYHAERERVFNFIKQEDIENVVVITGDIHTSWANDLYSDPYIDPANVIEDLHVGVEFVTPSITSSNFDEILGDSTAADAFAEAVKAENPGTKYVEMKNNGYLVLDITEEKVQSDFYHLTDIKSVDFEEFHAASWSTYKGNNELQEASEPTTSRDNQPINPDPALGITKSNFEHISIFPNPVKDVMYFNGISSGTPYTISSVDGKKIQEGKILNGNINTDKLSSGVYTIGIINAQHTHQSTFIKK